MTTKTALPMILARKCVEAACAGNAKGFRGLSSGWAQDEIRRIEKRICGLFGVTPGRVSQGAVTVEIFENREGVRRMVIDNDRGYYDHVIAA